MRTAKVIIALVLGLALATGWTSSAHAAEITWTNASGGNWSQGSNWTGGVVPGPNDTALITQGGTYTVTLDADTTVAGITIGASTGRQTLSMSSRTLHLNGPFTINTNGKASASNSTISGTGSILVSDTLDLIATTIEVPLHNSGVILAGYANNRFNGGYTNDAGTTLRLRYPSNAGASVYVEGGFTNNGLLELVNTYSSAGTYVYAPNGSLVNSPSGTISSTGPTGAAYIMTELDNQGTISLAWGLSLQAASANHTNSGAINLTGGSLAINQSGTTPSFTNTGIMSVGSGYILDVNSGAFDYLSGSITGTGTIDFNAVTATCVPKLNWAGQLNLTSSTLTISDSMFVAGRIPLSNSTINGTGNILVSDTLDLIATTIEVPLHNSGVILVGYANNHFNGGYTNDPGTTLRLTYPSNAGAGLHVEGGFTNNGLLELVNTYSSAGTYVYAPNGSLVNSPTGTISSTGPTGAAYIMTELDNQGTISLAWGLSLNAASAHHTNSGTINLTGGSLAINQSGTTPSFTNTGIMSVGSGYILDVNNGAFDVLSGSITGSGTIDFNAVTATWVPRLDWAGQLNLQTSTLTISDSMFVARRIPVSNSTIDGTGSILVSDTLALIATTIDVPLHNSGVILAAYANNRFDGGFTNDAGTTLRLWYISNAGSSVFVEGGFTNNGLLELVNTYSTAGTYVYAPNGSLTNSPTGTISSTGTAGPAYIMTELDNQGTMSLAWGLSLQAASANHTNSGAINLTGGSLAINQSGTTPSFTNTGTMTVGSGYILDVNSGAFDFPSGSITGDGTIDFNAVTATWVPRLDWAGQLNLQTSTLTISDSMLIANRTPVNNSTIDGTGNILVSDTLALVSSTIDVPLHNSGVILAGYANNHLDGGYTNDAGTTLRLWYTSNAGASVYVQGGFTNNGLLELVNTYSTAGTYVYAPSGSLVNSPTGTISATGTAGAAYIMTELDNEGAMSIDHHLAVNSASANHTNSGTIDLTGGNLVVNQSGTTPSYTNTGSIDVGSGYALDVNGGLFDNQSAGILAGNGTVDLTGAVTGFTNAGIINPGGSPGALTITGMDMAQETTSLINIEIEASTSGQFDSLAVVGNVTLGGVLNVHLYNGYFPALDDTIPFLSATSVSGDFDSLNLVIGGIIFDTVSSAGLVSLVCAQADNLDPVIALADTAMFGATDSMQIDVLGASGDPEYPDSLLTFGYTADNDSLLVTIDTTAGIMTLKSEPGYWGTVELIVTVNDPGAASASDTIMVTVSPAVSVGDDPENTMPDQFTLGPNYPNPFNPVTVFEYSVTAPSNVSITVFNMIGQQVRTLHQGARSAGTYRVEWDGKNDGGRAVASGVYLYRFQSGDYVESRKMLLLK